MRFHAFVGYNIVSGNSVTRVEKIELLLSVVVVVVTPWVGLALRRRLRVLMRTLYPRLYHDLL